MKSLVLSAGALAALVGATAAFAASNRTVTVHLISLTSLVHRAGYGHGQLVAGVDTTKPFDTVLCTIAIDRGSRQLRRSGLKPAHPVDGRLAWHWLIKPSTPLGRWHIRVDCGSAGSLRTSFKVVP